MMRDRKIVFWSHRRRPSFTMRGRQVAAALSARGWQNVTCRIGPSLLALAGLRDTIVVCVKSRPRFPYHLRARGNHLIFDAIDFDPDTQSLPDVDLVLCASAHIRARLRAVRPDVPAAVLYHHADPRIEPCDVGLDRLSLVYVGERKNSMFITGELDDLHRVDFKRPGWPARLRAFNAHFSARRDPLKSVVKLANSAAARAVFAGGPEPGAVEQLGADYPFFFDPDGGIPAARGIINHLREAMSTRVWQDALDRICSIAPLLSLSRAAFAYERWLGEV